MEANRLEDICLSHIINNFAIFNCAYTASEDLYLQRNLEFLQRAYSGYLIKKLCDTRELKAEYVTFLINRYLKELDFRKFRFPCWEKVIERVTEVAESFVKVTFEGEIIREYPGSLKQIVGLLKNVEYLYVPNECDNETVKVISRCCLNLKELDLRDVVFLSDEAVKSLCCDRLGSPGINSLRVLRLDCADIKNETIAFVLKNMPSLEVFIHCHLTRVLYSLHRNDLIENKLNTIKKYSLTELYFGSDYTTDLVEVLSICTVLCPNVTKLSCPVDMQEHIDLCSKFPKLDDLTMHSFNTQNPINLNTFLEIKGGNLISLNIEGFSVSTSVLIQNCQKLEKLRLKNVDLQWIEDVSVPTLKYLKDFSIDTENLPISLTTDAVCLILNSSPSIENLSILHSELSDLCLKNTLLQYCELNTLKYLNFSFSDVDINFLVIIIISCASLKTMNIEYCTDIHLAEVERLNEVVAEAKHSTEIIWNDEEISNFSLYSDYDDFADEYDAYDTDVLYGSEFDDDDDDYEISE